MIDRLQTSYSKYDPLVGKWVLSHKEIITRLFIALGVLLSGV